MDEKEEAKQNVAKLVSEYREKYPRGAGRALNEENTKDWIDSLFTILGWSIRHDAIKEESSGKRKRVDYAFKIDGTTKFLLEAKKPSEDLSDHIDQAVGYGYQNSKKWVVLTNFEEIRIYNAQYHDQPEEVKRLLQPLFLEDYVTRFDDLWVLSKTAFKEGLIEELAIKYGKIKPTAPVTKILAEDLSRWRETLTKSINAHRAENGVPAEPQEAEEFIDEAVQRILDRILFTRVTEDKGIEEPRLEKALRDWEAHGKPLIGYLKQVFREMDATYNSGLFDEHYSEDLKIDDAVLAKIIKESIKNPKGLRYNFDAIDADILGSVYEQYLSVLLKKTDKRASLKQSKGKRKEQGIYYTPTYIVDYIVKNTLGEALKGKTPKEVQKLKILDPACGSGSFLIKAFDEINDYYKKQTGQTKLNQESTILADNLYGVDLDLKAVEIARLNLLLKATETKHKLPGLEKNIKCGNSLIDDPAVAGERAFDWNKEFEEIMTGKKGGFDVIIGNPPYVRGRELPEKIRDNLREKFETPRSEFDIYAVFIEKGITLLRSHGVLGFIVSNKFLITDYGLSLRKFILKNCKIKSLVDVSNLQIFKDASVYPVIMIIEKEPTAASRNQNEILVQKIAEIKPDIFSGNSYKIPQKQFLENEGYSFDINASPETSRILEKMKRGSTNLGEVCNIPRGFTTNNDKRYVSKNSSDGPVVLRGGNIQRYNIETSDDYFNLNLYRKEKSVNEDLLKADKLLISQTAMQPRVAIDKGQLALQTVYFLVPKKPIDLYYLMAIMNSKIILWFYATKFEQAHVAGGYLRFISQYLAQIPIKIQNQNEIIELSKKREKIGYEYAQTTVKTDKANKLLNEIQELDHKIDELVYDLYGLTKEEREIVEKSVEK